MSCNPKIEQHTRPDGVIHDIGGVRSQTFTTEAGRIDTVQFDFGNYGHFSTPLQKLRVEVSNGDSPMAPTQSPSLDVPPIFPDSEISPRTGQDV